MGPSRFWDLLGPCLSQNERRGTDTQLEALCDDYDTAWILHSVWQGLLVASNQLEVPSRSCAGVGQKGSEGQNGAALSSLLG